MENQQLDPKVLSIVKALAYTENGGAPDVNNLKAGGSGETKSMFQFMPDTWKFYTKQIGEPNLPMTPENEAAVVTTKVQHWLSQGYDVNQIASMWNAGEQRPDAYKQGWKGTNSKGVKFDTVSYAKKVADYAKQFGENSAVTTSQTQPSPVAMAQPSNATPGVIPPFTLKTPQKSGGKNKGLMNQKSNPSETTTSMG